MDLMLASTCRCCIVVSIANFQTIICKNVQLLSKHSWIGRACFVHILLVPTKPCWLEKFQPIHYITESSWLLGVYMVCKVQLMWWFQIQPKIKWILWSVTCRQINLHTGMVMADWLLDLFHTEAVFKRFSAKNSGCKAPENCLPLQWVLSHPDGALVGR